MERFKNKEQEYIMWVNKNPNGYTFNHFGSTNSQKNMNVIHKARCHTLWAEKDENRRTTKYEKVCSKDLHELVKFVTEVRRDSWKYCGHCNQNKELEALANF